VFIPFTAGRYQKRRFKKANCPLVERLTNMMMTSGSRNNGSKQRSVRIIMQAMELINLLTGLEPVQVLVTAIQAGGAREDSTRIGSGGVVRRQAVDVSPLRRVNQAIYLICKGARESAFRNVKSVSECLADEIINAAKGTGSNSAAARKKDEIERVAKGNR
jgi:small subunit ribosomal protein S5e